MTWASTPSRGSSSPANRWPRRRIAATSRSSRWLPALPAVTAEVGDRRGFHIAETAGLSARAVCFDPWYLPEVMEASGVVPICGVQGSGKSALMGLSCYKSALSGARGVAMDPAGRLHRHAHPARARRHRPPGRRVGWAPGVVVAVCRGAGTEPRPDLGRRAGRGGVSGQADVGAGRGASDPPRPGGHDPALVAADRTEPQPRGAQPHPRRRLGLPGGTGLDVVGADHAAAARATSWR